MTKKKGAYIIIFLSLGLLVFNIYNLDTANLSLGSFSGVVSNLLLILAMVLSIRAMNKNSDDT